MLSHNINLRTAICNLHVLNSILDYGKVLVMDRDHVLTTLRAHEQGLKAAGILHLRLFGSVARNEPSSISDVDLMADFDPSKTFTLVTMAHLENRLTDILGVKVDLSSLDSMKEPVRSQAIGEAILVF